MKFEFKVLCRDEIYDSKEIMEIMEKMNFENIKETPEDGPLGFSDFSASIDLTDENEAYDKSRELVYKHKTKIVGVTVVPEKNLIKCT